MAEEPELIAPEQEAPAPMPAADGYVKVLSAAEWRAAHGESYQTWLRRQQRAFENRHGDHDSPYVRLDDDDEDDWGF